MILKPFYILFSVALVSAVSTHGHAMKKLGRPPPPITYKDSGYGNTKEKLDLTLPPTTYKDLTPEQEKGRYDDQKNLDPRTEFILERRSQKQRIKRSHNEEDNGSRYTQQNAMDFQTTTKFK